MAIRREKSREMDQRTHSHVDSEAILLAHHHGLDGRHHLVAAGHLERGPRGISIKQRHNAGRRLHGERPNLFVTIAILKTSLLKSSF